MSVEKDSEPDVQYVDMAGVVSDSPSFSVVGCAAREVVKVSCRQLECGRRPAHVAANDTNLARLARHGDWPWHVSLVKEGVHVCDGVLVDKQWVMSTASCFQGLVQIFPTVSTAIVHRCFVCQARSVPVDGPSLQHPAVQPGSLGAEETSGRHGPVPGGGTLHSDAQAGQGRRLL